MSKNGYIKTYRKLIDWEWYTDSNVKSVFIHCLLKANYEEKQWQGTVIERGTFVTSYAKLSSELNIPIQSIRTALSKLKSTHELTIKSTSKYSIISINNYELYQEGNTVDNIQLTNNQQTTNKQLTTTKEIKNNKNIKNIRNNSDSIPSILLSITNPKLQTAVDEFIDFRKKIKSPMTPKALELLISKLDQLTKKDDEKILILEQSVMNGWKSIYPLKDKTVKREVTNPDWLEEHKQHRQQTVEDKPVDVKELENLLNSFKGVN